MRERLGRWQILLSKAEMAHIHQQEIIPPFFFFFFCWLAAALVCYTRTENPVHISVRLALHQDFFFLSFFCVSSCCFLFSSVCPFWRWMCLSFCLAAKSFPKTNADRSEYWLVGCVCVCVCAAGIARRGVKGGTPESMRLERKEEVDATWLWFWFHCRGLLFLSRRLPRAHYRDVPCHIKRGGADGTEQSRWATQWTHSLLLPLAPAARNLLHLFF